MTILINVTVDCSDPFLFWFSVTVVCVDNLNLMVPVVNTAVITHTLKGNPDNFGVIRSLLDYI